MKRITYHIFFNNHFHSKSYTKTKWFPFYWSNKKIIDFCEKDTGNYASLCWVEIFGKRIWNHPYFIRN